MIEARVCPWAARCGRPCGKVDARLYEPPLNGEEGWDAPGMPELWSGARRRIRRPLAASVGVDRWLTALAGQQERFAWHAT